MKAKSLFGIAAAAMMLPATAQAADLYIPKQLVYSPQPVATTDYGFDRIGGDLLFGGFIGGIAGLHFELTNANKETHQVGTSITATAGCNCSSSDGFSFSNSSYDYFNSRTFTGTAVGAVAGGLVYAGGDAAVQAATGFNMDDQNRPWVARTLVKAGLGAASGAAGAAAAWAVAGDVQNTTYSNDVAFTVHNGSITHIITGDGSAVSTASRPNFGATVLNGAVVGLTTSVLSFDLNF